MPLIHKDSGYTVISRCYNRIGPELEKLSLPKLAPAATKPIKKAVVPFVQRATQLERLVMQTGHSAGDSFGMANARSAEEVSSFANELHQWIQWAASRV